MQSRKRPSVSLVELPFRLDPPGPWRLVGLNLLPPPSSAPSTSAVLTAYVSPAAQACTKYLDWARVDLQVSKDGKPVNVRVGLAGDPALGDAARIAVQSWKFQPGTVGRQSAKSSGSVVLECRAGGEPQTGDGGAVFKVGGGVQPPSIIFKVDPEYSESARQAKFSGNVLLNIVVGVDGRARDIHVQKPLGMGLDAEAVMAVSQWIFQPGMKNGKTVNVRATVAVNFRLL